MIGYTRRIKGQMQGLKVNQLPRIMEYDDRIRQPADPRTPLERATDEYLSLQSGTEEAVMAAGRLRG